MAEFILQTDPLEFQNSRQSTKIMFLQQELQQLQDHVKDLEQIVRINKEALKIATGQQVQPNTKQKPFAATNDSSTVDTSNPENTKNLQALVNYLQEENVKLLEIIEKVKQERNVAQSKALISEQIYEEAQRHEIETVAELEEKISDLRKLLQDKEYAIQELEKIKAIPEQEGVVVKFREVLNATEQSVKLHNEINALNAMLAKLSKEMNRLQSEKEQLQTINFSLTNELAKIKATFSSPLNAPPRLGLLGQINNEVDLNNSDFQGGVFQAAIGFDENSPLPSPLPDKVTAANTNIPKASVPKLNLTPALKIQEQIAKKITAQPPPPGNDNYNIKAMEKISQLEDELSMAKKRLSYEMINNRLLSDEITNLQRQIVQLCSTNELLIKSNKRYEEKWQKIFYTLEFYREFYHKYIDLITKGRTHMKTASTVMPTFEKLVKIKEKFGVNIDEDPDKLIKGLRKFEEENGNGVNVSILEVNEFDESGKNLDPEAKKLGSFNQFSKEQCKIYLLNMARDLYVNSNLSKTALAKQMLKKLVNRDDQPGPSNIMKLKRSLSNPLEYVSERKKLIFDTDLDKKNKKGQKNKQQQQQQEKIDSKPLDNHSFDIEDKEEGKDRDEIKKMTSAPKKEGEENLSFTVDADEFNKNKLVEVSFISNNDILDHIKQD